MTNNASESPEAEQAQASPKRNFTTQAEQAAFLQEMMTMEIDAKSLLEDSDISPIGNFREEKHLPSSRFKPLEIKVNATRGPRTFSSSRERSRRETISRPWSRRGSSPTWTR